jgi:hypothetical protein
MTEEDLATGGDQPETITAPAAASETEKAETPAKDEQSTEATTEDGKQPETAKTEEQKAAEASEAAKALNKRKQSYRERIGDITRKYRDEERRANDLAAKVAQLEGKIKPPNADDYTDPAKQTADQIDYTLDRRRVQDLKDQHAEASQEANKARALAWTERVNDFKEENADFEQVAFAAPIGKETSLMVADMEDGPAVAYHLGKNPAEARRIEGLPERQRPFELGKIAARVTAPPPRRVTTAPGPVETTSGKSGGGPGFDPSKASPAEFSAQYRKMKDRG